LNRCRNSPRKSARFRAQHTGVGEGRTLALHRDIQVILERQRNGILQ
jgi:hypothetical protein